MAKESINYHEATGLGNPLFVDVRTPAEFALDHIAGAINIPVLSNEQRALVGTIYKQESQKKATDIGVAYFSEKIPRIISKLRGYEGKTIIAYCWRGGMRSKAFVSFLRSIKFDILQLEGGYKDFRRELREELYNYTIRPTTYTIYGMTGTGKTPIIQELMPESIDLEGLAGHRSSIFGHVGLDPKSQKMFENMLLDELRRVDGMPHFFFEGESRKIGNINIPKRVFEKITTCEPIIVYSDISARVKRIVAEYFDSPDKLREVAKVLDSHVLANKLGAKNISFMKDCLKGGDYASMVEVLLLKYYDPMYKHSQKRIKGAVEFCSDDIEKVTADIKKYVVSKRPSS